MSNRERKLSNRVTMVMDRLSGLIESEFEQVSSYVDIVEIGWGLPNIWKEEGLISRIKFYQKLGVRVSMSGTLLEHSVYRNSVDSVLKTAHRLGFDMLEVSDGIIDLSDEQKIEMVKLVKSQGFDCLIAVGKKNPNSQLSIEETISQIKTADSLDPLKVVLEGRERGRGVGIYDEMGNIKWSAVRTILNSIDQSKVIFEAPSEVQQASLIIELGANVNLGNVALSSVAALESERRGLRFDTFGIEKRHEELTGGPSIKFVYFVIMNYQPINQHEIAGMTRLPLRTVQKAIEHLLKSKMISEHSSFEDRRSKIYRAVSASSPPSRMES